MWCISLQATRLAGGGAGAEGGDQTGPEEHDVDVAIDLISQRHTYKVTMQLVGYLFCIYFRVLPILSQLQF